MPVRGLFRATWREKLVTLASQGYGYEEFFERAKELVPKEYADEVLPQLPIIFMEVQCELDKML